MVSTQVLHRATALYPNATCLHQALINIHTFSSAMGLTGPKLVLTCVKKALGLDLYAPCRHLIELTVSVPLLARCGRGLYEQKLLLTYLGYLKDDSPWPR